MNKNLNLCSNKNCLLETCFLIKDKNSKEISRKLSKEILAKILDIEKEKILIEKNPHGKPFLKNFNNLHFSISHTKDASVMFFSSTPVGLDIEKIRKINLKIVNRFFCEKEKEFFLNQKNKIDAFFEIWTRKEAYIKYLGVGFSKLNIDTFLINEKIKTINIEKFFISLCKKEKNFIFNKETLKTFSLSN